MIRIYKEFTFEAAHQLIDYDGGCANVHGHSYRLAVGLGGETIPDGPNRGFVMDFRALKARVKALFLDDWDHGFLAEGTEPIVASLRAQGSKVIVLGFRPTAENMSRHILTLLLQDGLPVQTVKLWETATSWAEVRAEDVTLSQRPAVRDADRSLALPVSELFGPTIQGEGPEIGQKSLFLRIYGCDDHCTWCDTAYAWDGSEQPSMMPVGAVLDRLKELAAQTGCRHVTITGGNPCIHGDAMASLLLLLREAGFRLSLETQGTAAPDWLGLLDLVTISPKPPSSGNITEAYEVSAFIGALGRVPYAIKIVIMDDRDLSYAKDIFCAAPGAQGHFLQPCRAAHAHEDVKAAYARLCENVLADPELENVRILPQLHTWLWGDQREV